MGGNCSKMYILLVRSCAGRQLWLPAFAAGARMQEKSLLTGRGLIINFTNMELNQMFKDGRWSKEINVADFVHENITPYEGDASFLVGPTERTKKIWDKCLEALAEERANNGVRSLDNKTVSTITSHKAGYIDRENELIVGLQTDEL